jgi:hypothetical protein
MQVVAAAVAGEQLALTVVLVVVEKVEILRKLELMERLTQVVEVEVVVDCQPPEPEAKAALALSSLKCLTM